MGLLSQGADIAVGELLLFIEQVQKAWAATDGKTTKYSLAKLRRATHLSSNTPLLWLLSARINPLIPCRTATCRAKCCDFFARTHRGLRKIHLRRLFWSILMHKTAQPIVEFTKNNAPFPDRIGYAKTRIRTNKESSPHAITVC
jgi:hypothetical protein